MESCAESISLCQNGKGERYFPVFGLQWKGSEIGWKWNEGESDQEGLKTKQLEVKGTIEVDQDDNVFGKWRKWRDRGALFELKGFSRLYPFTREGSRNKE